MAELFNSGLTVGNDEWLTPLKIIKALGEFDLDPASPINRPWDTANKHYTKLDDGLSKDWEGRVWLNPPYGEVTFKWLHRLADHGNGIALIYARTETIGFFREVWDRADAIFFFKGRLKFYTVKGEQGSSAGAPSCLVLYGKNNIEAVQKAIQEGNLVGKLVLL